MCVCLLLVGFPEQDKNIVVIIIIIIIIVFALCFGSLADIRGESDRGGAHGEFEGGKWRAAEGRRRGPLRESMWKSSGAWKGGEIQTN